MKKRVTTIIREQEMLQEGIYRLHLQLPGSAGWLEEIQPGQFVMITVPDSAKLLPRPISLCSWDAGERSLTLVYRVSGEGTGTRVLSRQQPGTPLEVLGILGNGYDLSALSGRRVLLIGGGIGAPPLYGLARALHAAYGEDKDTVHAVLGYRTANYFLTKEFSAVSTLHLATDDGSGGYHGNSVEASKELVASGTSFDALCACGPLPMLRGVKTLSEELSIPAYLSLEERMACGVGVCLGCVTKTTGVDPHSGVHNARVCTEGPVFLASEVVL